jgi:hydroxyacylglutathione hydrolase
MEIKCLHVGQLQTNCYLLWNDSRDCFIIDPGDDADYISTEIINHQLTPQAILLTHGHYDHCLACLELKLNFNIPIYLNEKDNFLYQNASKSANHWSATKALKQPPTLTLPKEIKLGEDTIEVIPIPGHTPGSVCFYSAPHLFVGDTIFRDGVGRTDFAYSSSSDLKKSLAKIHSFPDETLIYPGHEDTPVFLSDIQE